MHSRLEENLTIAYRASIRDLYRRLREQGFDRSFILEFVLPEWWADELADVEANRALAESYVAKQLGFSLQELRDPERPLSTPSMAEARFKRYKNEVDTKVLASALLAQQVAGRVVRAVADRLPPFQRLSASKIREEILRNRPHVDLEALVGFCWRHGILVLQLAKVPSAGKGFDGMAAFVDDHPVILLASNRDSPPWLAFHLAHELGHVMLEHVDRGQTLLDPSLFRRAESSRWEEEADAFACEVLTGRPDPRMKDQRLSAPKLAVCMQRGSTRLGVDPGVLALVYAKSNDRWGAAQTALRHLGLDTGGRQAVSASLADWMPDLDELSEADERLLNVLTLD